MNRSKIHFPSGHRNSVWLIIYCVYLAVLTLSPFQFSLTRLYQSYPMDPLEFISKFVYFRDYDMLMNGLLFLPLGILIYRLSGSGSGTTLFRAMLYGGLVSFGIECIQFFLDRSPNGTDILMNAAGTGLGFALARFYEQHQESESGHHRKFKKWVQQMVLLIYGLCVVLLLLFPLRLTTPDSWNPNYPLMIGNERSMDRPWLGDIRLAAIYNRAVTEDQASLLSSCVPDSMNVPFRRHLGMIALYPFVEMKGDTIYDRSGYGEPLNLAGDSILWIPGGGVRLNGGIIESTEPGTKITRDVLKSGAFSVEVRCRPSSLTQDGPARIVSFSKNVSERNFALAQQGKDVHLRVRSHMGGENGNKICLRAKGVLTREEVHLIATYSHGVEQLFVNGKRHRNAVFGHIGYLSEILGLGSGTVGQFSSGIALLFPLAMLVTCSAKRFRVLAAFFFTWGTAALADLFFILSFGAPVCTLLWVTALLSALLAVILYRIIR